MQMSYPATYAAADALLTGRSAQRRKLGNNTYAERRPNGDIAIRLHATDVVTHHANGSVSLDTGGWLTVTTKDRINEVMRGRGFRVYSDRGRWFVAAVGGWDHPHAYADGMTISADGTVTGVTPADELASQDEANRLMRRKVSGFVKAITPDQIVKAWEDTGGDCFLCKLGQADCLALHVEESYFHATLAHNALKAKGYRDPGLVMSMVYAQAQRGSVDSLLTQALRKYLYSHLTLGTVAAGNGHPATAQRF